MKLKTFYRRNLPHITLHERTYFITFWLENSIPTEVTINLKAWYDSQIKTLTRTKPTQMRQEVYNLQKKYFGKFDSYLNRNEMNINYLQNEKIAELVSESILYRDKKVYDLINYCIMPNHVHLVIYVEKFIKPLYRILQSLKRHTARHSNLILNRTGTFWHHESYDHIVRNNLELSKIIVHNISDPVNAGLVKCPDQWQWSYCKF